MPPSTRTRRCTGIPVPYGFLFLRSAPAPVSLTGTVGLPEAGDGEPGKDGGMAWTWRSEDAEGRSVAGPAESFTSQSDAESWIGQSFRELYASGVAAVALIEDDRVEYQMSLAPAGE